MIADSLGRPAPPGDVRLAGRAPALAAPAATRLAKALALGLAVALVAGYVWLWVGVLTGPPPPEVLAINPAFTDSDFFIPWYGARGLVAGKNPYDDAFYRELHRAYYGGVIEPESGVRGLAAFGYPPYVVVSLLPVLWLPYDTVRWLAAVGLGVAVAASACLWDRVASGQQTWRRRLAVAVLALLFQPTVSLLVLQQLSGLVLLYLAGAHAAVAKRRHAWGGALLALAMIKPQIALVPAAGLLSWSLWRRERWGLAAAFGATMAAQLALAEHLLPGWLGPFIEAAARYRRVNTEIWLPRLVAGGQLGGTIVAGSLLALLACLWWRHRGAAATSTGMLHTVALGFAVGPAVVPDVAGLYNRVLLLVPVLALASAGPGTGVFRRATHRLAALVLIGPIAIMGVLAWLRWLAPGLQPSSVLIDLVDAVHTGQPVLLLPALVALALEREGDRP